MNFCFINKYRQNLKAPPSSHMSVLIILLVVQRLLRERKKNKMRWKSKGHTTINFHHFFNSYTKHELSNCRGSLVQGPSKLYLSGSAAISVYGPQIVQQYPCQTAPFPPMWRTYYQKIKNTDKKFNFHHHFPNNFTENDTQASTKTCH